MSADLNDRGTSPLKIQLINQETSTFQPILIDREAFTHPTITIETSTSANKSQLLGSPMDKIDTSSLYDVPKTSPFRGHLDSVSDIASSNWS